jgi:hypothetical protein
MITVGYGMHRKKEEVLVGEMMKELSEKPYKNLNFLLLSGKDLRYLASHTNEFVFDVHGGSQEIKLLPTLRLPATSFLLFSSVVEDKFLPLLRKYRTGEIYLIHKNKGSFPGNLDYWQTLYPTQPEYSKRAIDRLKKYGLIDRLVVIECLNAMEKWQIELHRSFMEMFLDDLDNFADSSK